MDWTRRARDRMCVAQNGQKLERSTVFQEGTRSRFSTTFHSRFVGIWKASAEQTNASSVTCMVGCPFARPAKIARGKGFPAGTRRWGHRRRRGRRTWSHLTQQWGAGEQCCFGRLFSLRFCLVRHSVVRYAHPWCLSPLRVSSFLPCPSLQAGISLCVGH